MTNTQQPQQPGALESAIPRFAGSMLVLILVTALVTLGVVMHQPTPAAAVAKQVQTTYAIDHPLCQVTDPALGGLSGMATRADGVWVINDRGTNLFRLNSSCRIAQTVSLTQVPGGKGLQLTDTEALTAGPDGWLWVGDVGGNTAPRETVRLIGYRDATTPLRIVTLAYPDGPHDVEAFVVDNQERATLITKVSGGNSTVFTTPQSLRAVTTQKLVKRGTIQLAKPAGSGPGSRLVTDAALSPTSTQVVLRTYTNAWEYDVPDGDVASALLGSVPRLVPLPTSVQGEAIAYTQDATALLTTGEQIPVNIDVVRIARFPQ